jgi:hypothetical protein
LLTNQYVYNRNRFSGYLFFFCGNAVMGALSPDGFKRLAKGGVQLCWWSTHACAFDDGARSYDFTLQASRPTPSCTVSEQPLLLTPDKYEVESPKMGQYK